MFVYSELDIYIVMRTIGVARTYTKKLHCPRKQVMLTDLLHASTFFQSFMRHGQSFSDNIFVCIKSYSFVLMDRIYDRTQPFPREPTYYCLGIYGVIHFP